ncbi:MAG: hypothetical protein KGZ30_02125 [Anaplasmataceae bacterium]|nr:hypothetical protein [Anaplasmataceae bacterium]
MNNKKEHNLHLLKAQGRLHSQALSIEEDVPRHGNLHLIQCLLKNHVQKLKKTDITRQLEFKLLSYPNFRLLHATDEPHTGPLYAVASEEQVIQKNILRWLEEREKIVSERLENLKKQIGDAEEHWKKWRHAKDTTILQRELKVLKREYLKIVHALKETTNALHYLQALETEWRRELLELSSV